MEIPPKSNAVNLEDSGFVVDGLRGPSSDGDDENSLMVSLNFNYKPFGVFKFDFKFLIISCSTSCLR